MRRSAQVAAPLLAAAALTLLTSCRQQQPEMQRCVDENNRVVADTFCQQPGSPGSPYPYGYGYRVPYRFYYGGGGGYGLGSPVFGGGYSSLSGHTYSSPSSTVRGGFGSTHASSGEGASE